MSPVSRGFRHLHRPSPEQQSRVPPGQYLIDGFPVLSAGPTPHTPPEQWTFSIKQGTGALRSWGWTEFLALPSEPVTTDIHCVTRWSKLDTRWTGVSVDTVWLLSWTPERWMFPDPTVSRPAVVRKSSRLGESCKGGHLVRARRGPSSRSTPRSR